MTPGKPQFSVPGTSKTVTGRKSLSLSPGVADLGLGNSCAKWSLEPWGKTGDEGERRAGDNSRRGRRRQEGEGEEMERLDRSVFRVSEQLHLWNV